MKKCKIVIKETDKIGKFDGFIDLHNVGIVDLILIQIKVNEIINNAIKEKRENEFPETITK